MYEDALTYHVENQGVWERYIRLVDLDRDDPAHGAVIRLSP